MGDVFSAADRSRIMARVKDRGNKATELRLIEILNKASITGWRRRSKVFGKPDFVFPKQRVVVFVDGCFWHNCPKHGTLPATNSEFWQRKLQRNFERDRVVNRQLKNAGWRIVRVWQHDLKEPVRVVRKLRRTLLLPP
jgi:DNA mismatch endonuclease, patch repair protein